jgi:hypothetical protein
LDLFNYEKFRIMKKIKGTISALFVILWFSSCETNEMYLKSSYPQLQGTFRYYSYESWEHGLYEIMKYDSWKFDDSRKSWNYYNYWSYTTSGWTNASKEGHGYYMEWKIENGVFYEKLWDNEYSSWTSHSFEYIDKDSFKLDGDLFVRHDL